MIAPLSLQQEWLWPIVQRERRWNFLTAYAWRLAGPLRVDILKRCFDTVVHRHECLRTRIVLIDGIPKQQVDEPREHALELVELGAKYDAYRYVSVFFSRYFDLAHGPVLQTRLLRVADEENVLAIAMHHIVSDAVSVGIFFRELWALYRDYITGRPPALGPVRMQYSEYATAQQNGERHWRETHAPYWKARLRGTTRLRPAAPMDSADIADPKELAYRTVPFGTSLTASVNRASRAARTSPSIAVFALYTFAMAQFCTQRDLVIWNNLSGRDASDLMNVMGYFVHLVPMRVQLTGRENFLDLLRLVADEFLAASAHLDRRCVLREFPEMSGGTFFQWISTHPNRLRAQVSADEGGTPLSVTAFPVIRKLAGVNTFDFDAGGAFYETDRGITGTVSCRPSLCSPQQLDRFCAGFRALVERVVNEPRATLTSHRWQSIGKGFT